MADPTLRLAVAYGLIAILALAAILCAVLLARNSTAPADPARSRAGREAHQTTPSGPLRCDSHSDHE
jgi:hypothetical protein